jgi:hypothetical protein
MRVVTLGVGSGWMRREDAGHHSRLDQGSPSCCWAARTDCRLALGYPDGPGAPVHQGRGPCGCVSQAARPSMAEVHSVGAPLPEPVGRRLGRRRVDPRIDARRLGATRARDRSCRARARSSLHAYAARTSVAPPDVRGRVARARTEGSQGHTRSRAPQAKGPGARLCHASSARSPPSLSVWSSRSFQLLCAARTMSLTGSAVTLVVRPILVFQRTGSPLQTSLLVTLEAVPTPCSGWPPARPADWPRRRLLPRVCPACQRPRETALARIP